MKKNIEKLLAILDMPEKEQGKAVNAFLQPENCGFSYCVDKDKCPPCPFPPPLSNKKLADLAFRLKNEVSNGKLKVKGGDTSAWYLGLEMVEGYLDESNSWFMHRSQPIEWIIAALIAKELI